MSIEEMLAKRLAEIRAEMKQLAAERNKVRAAIQAVKGLDAQETGRAAGDMTFKDKIKICLRDKKFRGVGATASEVLEWCNMAWPEQPMMRSSLSPQLSRLKAEGIIELIDKNWVLIETKEKGSEVQPTEPLNLNSILGDDDDPLA